MSYNMTGLGNLPAVLDINTRLKPTFIALQETWLRSFKNARFTETLRTHTWFIKNADTQLNEEDMVTMRNLSFHGVALGVASELSEKTREIKTENKNIVAVKVSTGGTDLLVINVYMPTMGKDQEFEEATDAIKQIIETTEDQDQRTVILGDINLDEKSSTRRKRAWEKLLEEFDLTDNITGTPTHFHHASDAISELDRFITKNADLDITTVMEDIGSSDHIPIQAELRVQEREQREQVLGGLIETNVNIALLKENKELFEELTNTLADDIQSWRRDYDLDTQNAIISSMIFKTAIEVTGQKQFQSQKERKKKKYKIDKELRKGLQVAKKNYKRQPNKSRKSQAYRRVKHFKRLINKQIQEQMANEEWKLNSEIMKATKEKSSRVFALLKKVKQETVNENKLPSWIEGYGLKFEAPAVLEGMRELFRQQTTIDYVERFNEERFEAAKDIVEKLRNCEWTEEEYEPITITEEEFAKIVEKMKTGKAQDFMGMSNDLLKNSGDRMKELIYDITRESLETRSIGGIIRNYGKGTVIIKKKGKPTTIIKNWRKIVCNNTILNVLQLHVQPRIEKKAKRVQTEYQMGFTAGIPVSNAVIAREELQQLSRHMNRTFFLGVLDLQSCFPRISREEMLVLAADLLTPAEWDVLSQIYDNTWGELRVQSQKSKPMRGDIGSIEGGVLSVQILKIYIAVLLRMLEKAGFKAGVHFTLRRLRPGQIGIADDILLYTWVAAELEAMLEICEAWSNAFRATFSPEKSVVVIQRARGDGKAYGPFKIYGQELSVVRQAEHLGIPIDDSGDNSEALVTERISKTRRAIHGTLSLFDNRCFVTAAVKLQVWRTQYRHILIFGLDTSNLKASQLRKIEQFQIKVLRSIFKLSKRASGTKLRLITGTTTMTMEIWKNRFGALNNILIGSTMARELCALAYHCEVKQSWTFKTIQKMFEILDSESASHLVNAEDFLSTNRNEFKENNRNLMFGVEVRKLRSDLKDNDIYNIPSQPFKEPMTLINTGFNFQLQNDLRKYVAVYTGDFYRLYNKPCPLCEVDQQRLSDQIDGTRHLLSGKCVVDENPRIQEIWANIVMTVACISEDHPIAMGGYREEQLIAFLLNPSETTSELRIAPESLQLSGLDNLIRRLLSEKYYQRYRLLRKLGIIKKK